MKTIRSLLAVAAVAAIVAVLPAAAQTAADLIKTGDELSAQMGNDAKALEAYLAAVQAEPGNYEALWKAARSCIDVGDLVNLKEKSGEEARKKYFKDSQSLARKAVAANGNDTWGHFYLSASLGKYALTLGKKEQVQMSREVKAEIEKAIELDATNDLAYHALALWHRKMAEIGGAKRFFGGLIYGSIPKGTFEDSEKNFLKAVELRGDYINHHLELGRTYVALDKYDLAVQEFQKCLDLPVASAKDQAYKDEAKKEQDAAKKKVK
jgi:tetratricopeptide (TPR) repeat protein